MKTHILILTGLMVLAGTAAAQEATKSVGRLETSIDYAIHPVDPYGKGLGLGTYYAYDGFRYLDILCGLSRYTMMDLERQQVNNSVSYWAESMETLMLEVGVRAKIHLGQRTRLTAGVLTGWGVNTACVADETGHMHREFYGHVPLEGRLGIDYALSARTSIGLQYGLRADFEDGTDIGWLTHHLGLKMSFAL